MPQLLRHPAMTPARVERLLALYALSVACAEDGDHDDARAHLLALRDLAVSEDRSVWLAVCDAALMRLDVRQYGDHPAVERSYALYQRLAVSLWHERIARFDALSSRMRVLELLAHGDRITELTRTDDLTGVGNRRALEQALDRQGSDVAAVFVDVDLFKQVNDRFSHVVGDAVLVRLAQILREQVRTGDTVVRFGGDEFLVVLDASVTGVRGARAADQLARPARRRGPRRGLVARRARAVGHRVGRCRRTGVAGGDARRGHRRAARGEGRRAGPRGAHRRRRRRLTDGSVRAVPVRARRLAAVRAVPTRPRGGGHRWGCAGGEWSGEPLPRRGDRPAHPEAG